MSTRTCLKSHHEKPTFNIIRFCSGILFARGLGVERDLEMAVELFEYAVSLGAYEAMASAALAIAS